MIAGVALLAVLALVGVRELGLGEALAIRWAHLRGRRWGAPIRTRSGGYCHPLDMAPEEVRIEDVAAGLAKECRYTGQCAFFYSVALHSVLVSRVVERLAPLRVARRWALEALLHDASEAYLGDVARPFKVTPAYAFYRRVEARCQAAIERALGIVTTRSSRALVHAIDRRICSDEIPALFTSPYSGRYGEPTGAVVIELSPASVEALFLERYRELAA